MVKRLNPKYKRKVFPIIEKRDGDICFFCVMMFVPQVAKWNRTYHHLNKNTEDNRPENLVFAHEECNRLCEDKSDWQIRSTKKLLENEKYHQYVESDEEIKAHNDEDKDTNVEIDTNELYLKLSLNELNERLVGTVEKPPAHESINFKNLCMDISYLVNEEVAHGSPITASRAIETLCSSKGDFEKFKEKGGKWRIKKRKK